MATRYYGVCFCIPGPGIAIATYIVQGNTRSSAIRRARRKLRDDHGQDVAARATVVDIQPAASAAARGD